MLGNEAKAAWEKLRHAFRDALRRQAKYLRNGALPETIKIWRYQKQMGFLRTFMANTPLETYQIGQRSANLLPETEYIKIEDPVLTLNSEPFEITSDVEKGDQKEMMDTRMEMNDSEHETLTELQILPTNTKPQKEEVKYKMTKRRNKSKKKTQERAKLKDSKVLYKDPLYHFFMSMYESTKIMPPSARHTVKKKVFQAVSEIEASLLTSSSMNDNRPEKDITDRLNSDPLDCSSDSTTSQSYSLSSSD